MVKDTITQIPGVPEKIDKNKMTINFCFIIDILFMNSFPVLLFFKKGLTKKTGVLIISLPKIFTNEKNWSKQAVQISFSFNIKMDNWKLQFYSHHYPF